jgi:hypothetical protein
LTINGGNLTRIGGYNHYWEALHYWINGTEIPLSGDNSYVGVSNITIGSSLNVKIEYKKRQTSISDNDGLYI